MPPSNPYASITSLINTHLSQRSTTFPSSALFDLDLSTALSKYQHDPNTLTIKELQSLLRRTGHPVSGKKADLLERLRATDDVLAGDFMADSTFPTESVNFDGIGGDPATLIGQRLRRFEYDASALKLFTFEEGGCVAIAIPIPSRSSNPGIELDAALLEGLAAICDWKVSVINSKAVVVRREHAMKPDGRSAGLLVIDATTAMRKGRRERYRVVGLRCEGMVGMGYVFAREQDVDDADVSAYSPPLKKGGLKFSDVAVASGLEERGYTFG